MQKQNISSPSLKSNPRPYHKSSNQPSIEKSFLKKSNSNTKTLKTDELSIRKLFKESANRTQNLDYRDFVEIETNRDDFLNKFQDFLMNFKIIFIFTGFFLGLAVIQTIFLNEFQENSHEFQEIVAFVRIAIIVMILMIETMIWRKINDRKRRYNTNFEVFMIVAVFVLIFQMFSDFFLLDYSKIAYFSLGFSCFFISSFMNFKPFLAFILQIMIFLLVIINKYKEFKNIQSVVFSSIIIITIILNYWLINSKSIKEKLKTNEIHQSNENKHFYKSFLNLFPDGLAFIGQDLDLEYANKSFMGFFNNLNQKLDFKNQLKNLKNLNFEEKEKKINRMTVSLAFGTKNEPETEEKNKDKMKESEDKISNFSIEVKKANIKSYKTLKSSYNKMNTLRSKTNKSLSFINKKLKSKKAIPTSTGSFLQILTKKDSIYEKSPNSPKTGRLLHTDQEGDFLESMIFGQVKKVDFSKFSLHLPNILLSNHRNLLEAVKTTLEKMKVFKERKKDLSRFNSDFNSILLFKTLLDSKSLEIRIIPIFYQDEPKLIISLNDCTDLMTIELLKRTDEYKNILMSYVSHELRTPLNGMLAMIESLKERVSAEINEQFIDPSLSCGRNLLYLINDILDFEQIRKGKMRLFESDFRLRNCLEDALNIVRLQSHKKGLELYLSIDNQIPISISTDANRLRQIVLNLLGNALKFTIKGSITLQVTPYKSDSHVLQISVIDTGLGIKTEDQKKLFKQFGKLDLQEKNFLNTQGVGLGLIISNSLAIELGPKNKAFRTLKGLKVKSEPGKGSEFSFLLENRRKFQPEDILDEENLEISQNCMILKQNPDFQNKFMIIGNKITSSLALSKNLNDDSIDESSKSMILSKSPKKCNCKDFLIVEDNYYNTMVLENFLKKLDKSYENCNNGKEAIEKFLYRIREEACCPKYQAIFMDCEMPIMNGFDATKEIKRICLEKGLEMIIWGCTAYTHEKEKKRCLEAGMDKVLVKPMEFREIEALIRRNQGENEKKEVNLKSKSL